MSIAISTLANGLRVMTDTMPTVETVSLGAWIDVGTRHETKEINGISHLLEHMAFKGTTFRSASRISEEIETVGGQINAYTSREHTAYYAKILKEDCRLAVDIISDILQNSLCDSEELEREKSVVLQEISQVEDTPDDIIFDHFQATAYPGQALGQSVLGTPGTVRSISSERLQDYMRQNYTAPAMVLSAAGHIKHETLLKLAEEFFSDLPTQAGPIIEPACYQGGDFRQKRDLAQVHVSLGFGSVSYDHPDYYAMTVLSTLLGGGMSSRLFQEIREKRGLVYSIYSYFSPYRDGGLFGVYAGTGVTEVAEVIPLVCEEMGKIVDNVSEEELRRARAQLRAGILMGLESSSNRCEQLARSVQIYGRDIPVTESLEKIEAIDQASVARVAEMTLRSPLTVATLGDIHNVPSFNTIKGLLR